jgi:dTDP-L-rhamnose 4-epimerase
MNRSGCIPAAKPRKDQAGSMTGERVLITGGAGFVGSHVAGELLDHGYRVRVLDNLSSHVHGTTTDPPPCLDEHVEFVFGDLRDPDTVRGALQGVDAVVHAAALIGIGQSMYEMRQFVSENTLGTALLFEALIQHPVRRLIVASSMSVYGEGTYRAADGRLITRARRLPQRLRNGTWDI